MKKRHDKILEIKRSLHILMYEGRKEADANY